MLRATDANDDVLLAFVHVCDRRRRRAGAQIDLPRDLPGLLVIGPEHVAPAEFRHADADHVALAHEKERARQQWSGSARLTQRRKVEVLQQRVIAGSIAIGNHPFMVARVQVDGRDPAVWRLYQRKALHL